MKDEMSTKISSFQNQTLPMGRIREGKIREATSRILWAKSVYHFGL